MGKSSATKTKTPKSKTEPVAAVAATELGEAVVAAGVSQAELIERLARLEGEVADLRFQLAMCEGFDIVRRFRHHVMYDLVKTYNLEIPPRMNPKKRTNFPFLLAALEAAGEKVPEAWRSGLAGLKTLEKTCQFPLGFWDLTDNKAVTEVMIEEFIQKLPTPELQAQVRNMCQCSLSCTPPCARGNGNAPQKAQKTEDSAKTVEETARAVLKELDEKKPKKEKSVKKTSTKSVKIAAEA